MQGRQAAKNGDHERALELFRQSHALEPAPGTLLNIADCEERLGKLSEARKHYAELIEELPSTDERRTIAARHAAEIDQRAPRLRVSVARGAPEGTSVMLDGAPIGVGRAGDARFVDPGRHVIIATAPGHKESRITVTLPERAESQVEIDAGPAARGDSGKMLGGILLGVGGPAVGVGGTLLVLAARGDENAKGYAAGGAVTLGVGAALASVGVLRLLSVSRPASETNVGIAPMPGGLGTAVTGAF
ncbi:tetratricopeptide repeat protein [Polyangium aurulentum]|uniref:tetratricopeptide repeat protein n=1 Tax=Polyangium aurulentum TaxID=2567896 RepID=UPI0010ADE89F|nr:tetratricopeptide repeat protein [Polyangium aurulentum]UQA61183.1 hypothetical protein E8A73_012170 [Polyangium aurulentum]